MKPARLILLLAALGPLRGAPTLALGDNESLFYRVSWVLLPGAGDIEVSARAARDATGSPEMRIISTTATRGLARLLLPFDARAESLFDTASGRLLWFGESSETNTERRAAHTVVFDDK